MSESELLPAPTLPIYSPCVAGEMTASLHELSTLIYSNLMSPDYKSDGCFNSR